MQYSALMLSHLQICRSTVLIRITDIDSSLAMQNIVLRMVLGVVVILVVSGIAYVSIHSRTPGPGFHQNGIFRTCIGQLDITILSNESRRIDGIILELSV